MIRLLCALIKPKFTMHLQMKKHILFIVDGERIISFHEPQVYKANNMALDISSYHNNKVNTADRTYIFGHILYISLK